MESIVMRINHSLRDEYIFNLLYQCGGVGTAEHLKWNGYDQGKKSSQFQERLRKLSVKGLIKRCKIPLKLSSISCTYLYILTEAGAACINRCLPELSSLQIENALLRTEVVYQFNQRGYRFFGDFLQWGIDGFTFRYEEMMIYAFWNETQEALEFIAGLEPDPSTTSIIFYLTDTDEYLKWRRYIESVEYYRGCPYQTLCFSPFRPFTIYKVGEHVPFQGWYGISAKTLK